ncbi:hypothetical protein HAL_13610 [Haladaptatus sp. T7]|nr:hypothetical protein HAL_13610 [Haladaptatus sp. T7]
MKREVTITMIIIALCSFIFVPIVGANSLNNGNSGCPVSKSGDTRYIQSFNGVCVKSHFTKDVVSIVVSNPTDSYIDLSGILVQVDDTDFHDESFDIGPGQQIHREINITKGLDIVKNNHTTTVSTYGNYTTYNFTEKINASATDEIPTPYIANVTVADGTIDGEPSAVAYVTLVNPSMRRYPTKLFVHTIGTDGSFYAPTPLPNNSTTIKVELLDKRGTKIAGEARLYTGNLTKKQGGLDQVGFVGKAGEDTQQWNESFQPARPTWMNDHYQYENDTYSQSFGEKLSGDREIGGVPVVYLGLVVLVGLLFVRRWR